MENFETWLRSHRLSELYLLASGEDPKHTYVLTARVARGGEPQEYLLEFTREMLKLYEALTDINKNCFDTVDELLLELESRNEEIAAYKKIIKTFMYLLEDEDE